MFMEFKTIYDVPILLNINNISSIEKEFEETTEIYTSEGKMTIKEPFDSVKRKLQAVCLTYIKGK